jgi:hypothetical protein
MVGKACFLFMLPVVKVSSQGLLFGVDKVD